MSRKDFIELYMNASEETMLLLEQVLEESQQQSLCQGLLQDTCHTEP